MKGFENGNKDANYVCMVSCWRLASVEAAAGLLGGVVDNVGDNGAAWGGW